MMIVTTAMLLALNMQVAQAPASAATPASNGAAVDTQGACLDSGMQVPRVLGAFSDKTTEVVRIDKVISGATYTPNEIIGFLYTRGDGKTFLGQRTMQYTSPATAQLINQVLASTHDPSVNETAFPPQTKMGVKTNYTQFLQVNLVPAAVAALQIRLEPCVVWPAGRALPDPGPGP